MSEYKVLDGCHWILFWFTVVSDTVLINWIILGSRSNNAILNKEKKKWMNVTVICYGG